MFVDITMCGNCRRVVSGSQISVRDFASSLRIQSIVCLTAKVLVRMEERLFLRRIAIVVTGAVTAVLLFGSAASAHECFIANRSDRGDAAATHSDRWVVLTVSDIANFAPPGTDHACFIEYWTSHGGPPALTIRSDKTIGASSSNPNLANGKGLEHAEAVFGGLLLEAASACTT
jgi:hypothetical protein